MFPTRNIPRYGEALHWAALLAAALLALALAARAANGGETPATAEPNLLPQPMEAWAAPMTTEVQAEANAAQARDLWAVLNLQRTGELEAALETWPTIALPYENEVWREVAQAAAWLELGDLDRAAEALLTARQLAPRHTLVHYYTALLRLEQADRAFEWNDAVGPLTTRFAIHRPNLEAAPNHRDLYRMQAIMELEQALATAGNLQLDAALLNPQATDGPTVRDLLAALGAENYQATMHNLLGGLYLDRGETGPAEKHMDQAVLLGANVLHGYRELGRAYEMEGAHLDAARAYAKAAGHGDGVALPLKKMIENLRQGVLQGR